jgi:hypothetical protein
MSVDKISETLQIIKNDKAREDYFFEKLSVAPNPLEWLIPLKEAGYFNPEKNMLPYWNVLGALENMSRKNELTPNNEVSKILKGIVDAIINKDGQRVVNCRTDLSILRIVSYLPIEFISSDHIRFFKEILASNSRPALYDYEIGNSLLPKLIKENREDFILELLNVILHYEKSDNELACEFVSLIDSYYLKEILKKNGYGIEKTCGINAAKIGIRKISEILEKDNTQFNIIWIRTIENHEQTRFTDRYECILVHFVRDMLEKAEPKQIRTQIKELLHNKHNILKRLAYHLINHHYDSLHDLFWGLTANPLNNIMVKHEIYKLFEMNCKIFDDKQIKKAIQWIESEDFSLLEEKLDSPEKKEIYRARDKKEWLQSLLNSEHREIHELYEKYSLIYDSEIEHPGFDVWSSGAHIVEYVSPVDENELKRLNNKEMASFINSYKEEEDTWQNDFKCVNFASSLTNLVFNNPEQYSVDLKPFLSIPQKYQYAILQGFKNAKRENKHFECDQLLQFIKDLITRDNFFSSENDYCDLIAGEVSLFIWEGTQNNRPSFSVDSLYKVEEIILIFLENVSPAQKLMFGDFFMMVLNSPRGQVLMTAISYSLYLASLRNENPENKWVKSIKLKFTDLVKKENPELEFSIVIGWYFENLCFLDSEWVFDNFDKIFIIDNDKHWEAAFSGYMVWMRAVSEKTYKLFRDKGHYQKSFSFHFSDNRVTGKVAQSVAVGYLAGWDDVSDDGGLLCKMLKLENTKYMSELVWFIWSFRNQDNIEKEAREKIKILWGEIVKILERDLNNNEYRSIASGLGKWLVLFDVIDENIFDLLQRVTVKCLGEDTNAAYFIEYLLNHVEKTPDRVGDLYLDILNNGNYPQYKDLDIFAIVQGLYKCEEKEKADRICNLYNQKGIYFLRDIFELYNKKDSEKMDS